MRIAKTAMIDTIHTEQAFSEMCIAHLLRRTIRIDEDLVDQHGYPDEELIEALEPDQLASETSKPLPRFQLSNVTNLALWLLRIFVLLMTALVVYTFVKALR